MIDNPFFFHFAGGGRRHGRGHGPGGPPNGPPGAPFGFGGRPGPFGFWQSFFRGGGGQRARRGDVRAGILALLYESPRNGYQLMQELEQRSRGAWRPSPGSVYPALQLLEDEGLVAEAQSASGRVYELTEKGRAHVKANREEIGAPWESMAGGAGVGPNVELIVEMRALGAAVFQITRAGSEAQIAEAKKLLQQARRALYGLLAEADEDTE